MAEIDNSSSTEHGLRIVPWDIIRDGLIIPGDNVFDDPTFQICINRHWANRFASAIERLAWRDAWQGTEQQQQDAVEQVNIFLAELMLAKECKPVTNGCPCIIPVNTITNYYSSVDIQNQTIEEIFNAGDTITNILQLPPEEAIEKASELTKKLGGTDHSRCVASWFTLHYAHEVGKLTTDAWLQKYIDWDLVDLASDIIGGLAGILGLVTAGTSTVVAGFLASVFDEVVYQAALLIMGELSDEDLDTAVCELYSQMSQDGAGYTAFINTTFSNSVINDIWPDLASAEVYAGWLALASDPQLIDLSIQCCGECLTWWAAWSEVIFGHRYSDLLSVYSQDTGTTSRIKRINIRVNFDPPRRLAAFNVQGIGKRYDNVLGTSYKAKVFVEGGQEYNFVNKDGSDIENWQYSTLTTFYAPQAFINANTTPVSFVQFYIDYASVFNGSSSQIALYEQAWGLVNEINICIKDGTWTSLK